jgi:four helix bundle protein
MFEKAMARSAFETLEIYTLSERVADEVWRIVMRWDHFSRDTVGKQLVRAADSIGANIAEGHGRGSDPDHRRFIKIARGSMNETSHFLRRAYRRDLLKASQIEKLKPMFEELAPRLNAYLNSIGRNRQPTSNKQRATGN